MARIPTEELERLKAEIAVERLVESAGIELKAAGKDLLGRCPFHDDREASLVITPAKNLWHCFSCQIGGGPIDWMMKSKGVSFRHAVELLREGALDVRGPSRGRIRVLAPPVSLDATDQALLAETMGYYHERLKQTPEALAYLAKRGLNDGEMIERSRRRAARRGATSGVACRRSGCGANRDTSILTARSSSRSSRRPAKSPRSMAARSTTTCAKARRNTCICQVRIVESGTNRHSPQTRKSSSARP